MPTYSLHLLALYKRFICCFFYFYSILGFVPFFSFLHPVPVYKIYFMSNKISSLWVDFNLNNFFIRTNEWSRRENKERKKTRWNCYYLIKSHSKNINMSHYKIVWKMMWPNERLLSIFFHRMKQQQQWPIKQTFLSLIRMEWVKFNLNQCLLYKM